MADGTNINTATWRQFLVQLKTANVSIALTSEGNPYLRRELATGPLTAPLPLEFSEENAGTLLVGCFVFDSVCRKLEIELHEYFKGWYMTL
jgi:hypothetical protein